MEINGLLLVDKPKGMTSHDVIDILRSKLNIKKSDIQELSILKLPGYCWF